MNRCRVLRICRIRSEEATESGLELVTEAWLAVFVPIALMAGALAMQRFEHHLLGPAPRHDDDSLGLPRTGRATKKPAAATTAPQASAPNP